VYYRDFTSTSEAKAALEKIRVGDPIHTK